jgi:hypothetical protein
MKLEIHEKTIYTQTLQKAGFEISQYDWKSDWLTNVLKGRLILFLTSLINDCDNLWPYIKQASYFVSTTEKSERRNKVMHSAFFLMSSFKAQLHHAI